MATLFASLAVCVIAFVGNVIAVRKTALATAKARMKG